MTLSPLRSARRYFKHETLITHQTLSNSSPQNARNKMDPERQSEREKGKKIEMSWRQCWDTNKAMQIAISWTNNLWVNSKQFKWEYPNARLMSSKVMLWFQVTTQADKWQISEQKGCNYGQENKPLMFAWTKGVTDAFVKVRTYKWLTYVYAIWAFSTGGTSPNP